MEYGDKLKQRRLELGLTMQEVADKVGVSKPTIQRYESGVIDNMRKDKIALLAKALQVTPEFIIGINTKNQPQEKSLEADEKELIECYKLCSNEDKEELLWDQDAAGSNPVASTIVKRIGKPFMRF